MLMPKRVKHRKVQRGRMRGNSKGGHQVAFGEYGLKALERGWITNRQIEAARVAMTRKIKRGGKVWINVFPDKPFTKKPAETRMGSGKGNPEGWVAVIKPGRVMFELAGVPEDLAREAIRLAGHKLPIKTKFVQPRGGLGVKGTEVHALDDHDLVERLKVAREEAFNLRFRHATGELENSAALGDARRDVARLLTVARQRGIDLRKELSVMAEEEKRDAEETAEPEATEEEAPQAEEPAAEEAAEGEAAGASDEAADDAEVPAAEERPKVKPLGLAAKPRTMPRCLPPRGARTRRRRSRRRGFRRRGSVPEGASKAPAIARVRPRPTAPLTRGEGCASGSSAAVRPPRAAGVTGPPSAPSVASRAPEPRPPSGRREPRKVRQGSVVSTGGDKTITVEIAIVRRHPTYEKVVRRTSRLRAHDEGNEAGEGDVVRVIECRPISRTKRWRLVEILERAPR